MSELLNVSDQLLDDGVDAAAVPALKARRQELTALRAALEKAPQQAAQPPPQLPAPPVPGTFAAGQGEARPSSSAALGGGTAFGASAGSLPRAEGFCEAVPVQQVAFRVLNAARTCSSY